MMATIHNRMQFSVYDSAMALDEDRVSLSRFRGR